MDLKTLKKERLFLCADPYYDSFIDFDGTSRTRIFISSESKTEPPNYYRSRHQDQKKTALTDFKDPAPQMTKIRKRAGQVQARRRRPICPGTALLAGDYRKGRACRRHLGYPYEYTDAVTAGQVRGSVKPLHVLPGHVRALLRRGRLRPARQRHDAGHRRSQDDERHVHQANRGQRQGGHRQARPDGRRRPEARRGRRPQLRAFMTANLLAHCDLFAAGIARSGAYNRTLTPFGFQSERRTLWEAKDTYINMSPFMFADQIKTPILMIHGEMDDNSGNVPHSIRALVRRPQGFGATADISRFPTSATATAPASRAHRARGNDRVGATSTLRTEVTRTPFLSARHVLPLVPPPREGEGIFPNGDVDRCHPRGDNMTGGRHGIPPGNRPAGMARFMLRYFVTGRGKMQRSRLFRVPFAALLGA